MSVRRERAAAWQRACAGLGLLLALNVSCLAAERGEPLPKAAAAEDIHYALTRAEAVHPNLYWHTAKDLVLARAEALIAALPDPATSMDVYLALSRVMALLDDGHISVERPPAKGGGNVLDADRNAGAVLLDAAVQPIPGEGCAFSGAGRTA